MVLRRRDNDHLFEFDNFCWSQVISLFFIGWSWWAWHLDCNVFTISRKEIVCARSLWNFYIYFLHGPYMHVAEGSALKIPWATTRTGSRSSNLEDGTWNGTEVHKALVGQEWYRTAPKQIIVHHHQGSYPCLFDVLRITSRRPIFYLTCVNYTCNHRRLTSCGVVWPIHLCAIVWPRVSSWLAMKSVRLNYRFGIIGTSANGSLQVRIKDFDKGSTRPVAQRYLLI